MQAEITIKNYRCFPDTKPLHIEIREGFTAFVGINNSGKSSILRFFYEFRGLFQIMGDAHQFLGLLRGSQIAFPLAQSVKDIRELFSNSNDRDLSIEFSFPVASSPHPQPSSIVLTVIRDQNQIRLKHFVAGGNQHESGAQHRYVQPDQYPFVHIPSAGMSVDFSVLMDLIKNVVNALYIGAFRNAINIGTNENCFDIAVGQSFIKLWRTYKSGDVKKQNELIKQITRDISSIFELDLEINPTSDDQTLQVFVDDRSFKLNELGAGIAQFILVLGTAAIRVPTFVLIDEPELNLHPSLQLSFLTTLASYAQKGVIFSTHSIGLARAMAVRVYAVRRIKQGESEVYPIEGVPRYPEFLGELSFNGYQELGFDRIVLVEGPTEVRTIQQFLRQLKKDHKIVLLQLGGSSMINGTHEQELLELTRISKNISALIDSERTAAGASLEPSRQAFVEVCKKVGIACHVLERRSTENYLSDTAIKKVKGTTFKALSPFERMGGPTHWGKSENWLIARQMQMAELAGTDLLAFLPAL
jgi:ABC-type cobalamin/Fe3+-siderophores transport system ATPase subunit